MTVGDEEEEDGYAEGLDPLVIPFDVADVWDAEHPDEAGDCSDLLTPEVIARLERAYPAQKGKKP